MALELFANLPLGRYHAGSSWVHRLDPRLKSLGLPALVIAGFAADHWLQLALLAGVALILAAGCSASGGLWWRLVWSLRYLFLFTLVLHLLLSPGHTLFGQAWLSLDGLQLGARICGQLLLALIFSSLLTLTTTPEALAASFLWSLGPLRCLGLPLERWADNLLLVLGLIPVLQQESARLAAESVAEPPSPGRSLEARLQSAGGVLTVLLSRVVERADGLALALAQGERVMAKPALLPPRAGWPAADLLAALALAATLLLCGWLR